MEFGGRDRHGGAFRRRGLRRHHGRSGGHGGLPGEELGLPLVEAGEELPQPVMLAGEPQTYIALGWVVENEAVELNLRHNLRLVHLLDRCCGVSVLRNAKLPVFLSDVQDFLEFDDFVGVAMVLVCVVAVVQHEYEHLVGGSVRE